MTAKALALSSDNADNADADQYVLNQLFKEDILITDQSFNYQTGLDYVRQRKRFPFLKSHGTIPAIIHYNTSAKPWNTEFPIKFKHIWWYYHQMNW